MNVEANRGELKGNLRINREDHINLGELMFTDKGLPDIESEAGERWFAKDTTLEQDMKEYWGDWGCSSEVNKLRAVIMHRPGAEIENFDFNKVRFRAPVDPAKFIAQHDALADYYRSHGVTVHYVDNRRVDKPNAVFCRDKLFMTPEGAIIMRLAMEERRGEERFVAETCARLGVPIIRTISGDGLFEGANALWVDRKTVILSLSVRANKSGYDQMEYELRRQGVTDIITMQVPYGHAHIDGLINFASHDLVFIYAPQVPFVVVDALRKKGFKIVEAESHTEVKYGHATNFVAVEPGRVVTSNLAPRSAELLEKHGIIVDQLDLSELNKGRGSVHCMTAFLKRDDQ